MYRRIIEKSSSREKRGISSQPPTLMPSSLALTSALIHITIREYTVPSADLTPLNIAIRGVYHLYRSRRLSLQNSTPTQLFTPRLHSLPILPCLPPPPNLSRPRLLLPNLHLPPIILPKRQLLQRPTLPINITRLRRQPFTDRGPGDHDDEERDQQVPNARGASASL